MISDDLQTEAGVVANLAARIADRVEAIEPDSLVVQSTVLAEGEQQKLDSLERFLESPRRERGTFRVIDVNGFAHLVGRITTDASIIFANEDASTLTAIFNFDTGWRDHRAVLELKTSPEWQHWAGKSGTFMNQVQFAEHLEDGVTAIISPSPADLMEVASTFQAKRSLSFESGTRLRSGDVKFVYHEETKAGAGVKGDIEIPETIELRLPVYRNSGFVDVTAKLRYRITPDGLKLGFKLERLPDVVTAAFAAVVAEVAGKVGEVVIVNGYAPDPVTQL